MLLEPVSHGFSVFCKKLELDNTLVRNVTTSAFVVSLVSPVVKIFLNWLMVSDEIPISSGTPKSIKFPIVKFFT